MNEKNNLKEKLFYLEREKIEKYKKKKVDKLIKSVSKNIVKIFIDQLNGKTGEC